MNTWSHLVATFDGGTARIYKNGALVGTGDVYARDYYCPGQFTIPTGGGVLWIGERNDGYPFQGLLDEVAIYGAALSGRRSRIITGCEPKRTR